MKKKKKKKKKKKEKKEKKKKKKEEEKEDRRKRNELMKTGKKQEIEANIRLKKHKRTYEDLNSLTI